MKERELLDIIHQVQKLKVTYRHCFFKDNRQESVADHSYNMCAIALLLNKEIDFDLLKVLKMCIIHDLGETFTGDVPTFLKTNNDSIKEDEIMFEFLKKWGEDYIELYKEMLALETKEAKIYKAIDKMEAIMSHNECDINTWLPLEYELQYTYGKKEMTIDDYLIKIREGIDKDTSMKIKGEK